MPTCPNCNQPLMRQKTLDGVIYICPRCRGTAIGLGVLRRDNISPGLITQIWQKVFNNEIYGNRQCPHCQKPMSQISKSINRNMLTLDICKSCHVFWFDPNEFEILPKQEISQAAKDDELSEKARLALARLEIAEMKRQNADLDEAANIGDIVDILFIMIRNIFKP